MERLGQISFQTNDSSDVFLVTDVREDGLDISDESLMNIEDAQFDSDKAWVTGKVPRMKSVLIEGDTTIIHAWFKGEVFTNAFVISVYVECELAEELVDAEPDEDVNRDGENSEDNAELEPQEVNL